MRARRRPHLLVLAILVGLAVAAAGCGGDDDTLTATEPETRFEVDPGQRFAIVLDANPTTGYSWALSTDPPRDVVRLVDDRYLAPDTDLVGAGGHQELTFEAVGDGTTFIQLWYVRPFDDPPEPARRAQFEIIVGSGVPPDGAGADPDDRPQPALPDDEDALTVAELVEARPVGDVVVRGLAFDDGTGLVLCDVLAESFPPQCPGESIAVANPVDVEPDLDLEDEGGIRWSDRPVTVLGRLTDDGLEVAVVGRTAAG
jgi:inhibitor of cysteine peptidase